MSAEKSQFWTDLEKDMEDPKFAREYVAAAQEIRNRQQDARRAAEADVDPAIRYEGLADLSEVESWSAELDALALELTESADEMESPSERELTYRRAWLLRGAIEYAWRYEDLD